MNNMEYMSRKLKKAVNDIDDYFRYVSPKIYAIDPNSMHCWHRIYEAAKKRYAETSTISNMSCRDYENIISMDGRIHEYLPQHILEFDSIVNEYIYDLIVYDPKLFEDWEIVKNTLLELSKG